MTSVPSYHRKRPIRRDRVAVVLLVVVAAVVLPFVLRSGCARESEPLEVTGISANGTSSSSSPTTTPSTAAPSSTGSTPTSTAASAAIETHVVVQGDTLASIAAEMGVTAAVLQASNRILSASSIAVGQVLYASQEGIVHVIKSGQTLTDIALTYGVPSADIAEANGIAASATIFAGQRLVIPGVTSSYWQYVIQLSKGVSTRFVWPVLADVSSGFGWRDNPVYGTREFHDGIDLEVPQGTIVRAAAQGEVFYYGTQEESGNTLILTHADGYVTVYGHLASALVYAGQYVEQGQAIAQSGNTGVTTGPLLYFEIRNGEFAVDPLRYLP